MPVIRESEGRGLVHGCEREQCGTATVGIPQYVLVVTNEESPQPTPPEPPPTPPPTKPGQAISPSPANGSGTNYPAGLVLSWENGGGATSYVIWLNGVFMGTTFGTSFTPSQLPISTTFSWRIDSLNAGGITIGDTWTFTTANQVNPPAPPSPALPAVSPSPANGATSVSPTSVTLSWVDGGGALSYDVYLNGVFQANQASTNFSAGTLSDLTVYTWRIDSVNLAGTTVGTTWSFTTGSSLPSKPINPNPVNAEPALDPTAVTLSWTDGGGATSYDVYINNVFQVNQAGTSFNAGALTSFTAYTWRIDAVNGVGTTTGDTWAFTTSGHATVVSWAVRVVSNGGAAPSDPTKRALHTFFTGLDTDSLTAKMLAVNCFVNDSLIAALVPQVADIGNDMWTNAGTGFVIGDLSVNGLKGDGAGKYLDTGIIPSTDLTLNDVGVTVYNTFSADGAYHDTGAQQNLGGGNYNILSLWVSGNPNVADWDCYYGSGTGRISAANAGWTGFTSGNRTAANSTAIYQANSGVAFNTLVSAATSGGSPPTISFFVFALNADGVAADYVPHRLSFTAIHTGLTSGESQNLYNRVQTLRTTLGGGFV